MPQPQQSSHVRLPQRSAEVIGPKSKLNPPASQKAKVDSRTVTQDPALQKQVSTKVDSPEGQIPT